MVADDTSKIEFGSSGAADEKAGFVYAGFDFPEILTREGAEVLFGVFGLDFKSSGSIYNQIVYHSFVA